MSMPHPYFADESVTLYLADALAVLAALPTASVDALVTDPPYSSGGQFRSDRAQTAVTKYVNTDSPTRGMVDFTGDNRDQRGYLYWSALWLGEALRAATPGAIAGLFTDWRQLPITTDALQAGGWVWRGVVPWWKPNGRNTQGRPANTCEYFVWGTSGPRPVDAGETMRGFFVANVERDREHIAEKPLSVMRELVRVCPPGGTVLDPFCGAGTTGVAAVIEGRRFIGVEMVEAHLETTVRRIETAKLRGEVADQPALPLVVAP